MTKEKINDMISKAIEDTERYLQGGIKKNTLRKRILDGAGVIENDTPVLNGGFFQIPFKHVSLILFSIIGALDNHRKESEEQVRVIVTDCIVKLKENFWKNNLAGTGNGG